MRVIFWRGRGMTVSEGIGADASVHLNFVCECVSLISVWMTPRCNIVLFLISEFFFHETTDH